MVDINVNKKQWELFDVILWDKDITLFDIDKSPINDSQVIEEGVHFSIDEDQLKRFERLAKKNDFEYEFRK
jgi:hypothetical protein